MKLVTRELLDSVSSQAQASLRLRMNYNLHDSLDEPIHRMLNALEPGTYLPPHRHKNPDKVETYVILRGSLITAFFDEEGNIIEKAELNPIKGYHALEIPAGVWHSLVVLEPNTVIFEVKQGPYEALPPENIASWAPNPDDPEQIEAYFNKIIDF